MAIFGVSRRLRRVPSVAALAVAAVAATVLPAAVQASPAAPADPPCLIIESGALSVTETPGSSTRFGFTVRASAAPSTTTPAPLSIQVTGGGDWMTTPEQRVVNQTNWNSAQPYVVFNLSDLDTVDDLGVITMSAPGYRSASLTVTQVDTTDGDPAVPDLPRIIVEPAAVTITEPVDMYHTKSIVFQFRATGPPAAAASVAFEPIGTKRLGKTLPLLWITPTNWDQPQSVWAYTVYDTDTVDDVGGFMLSASGLRAGWITATLIDVT